MNVRRRKSETAKAFQGLLDYCQLGPGRSQVILVEKYQKMYVTLNGSGGAVEIPPTKSPTTLKRWSIKYDWVKRAEMYDKQAQQSEANALRKEKQRVLGHRFAQMHGRVEALSKLADFLETKIFEERKDEEDEKRSGDMAGELVVPFRRFVIREYRETLEDIAKEVGERQGSPVDVVNWSPEEWSKEAEKRIDQSNESLSVLDLVPEETDEL